MDSRLAAYRVFGMLVLTGLCAASIIIGWVLLLASLLYVVSDLSLATFQLTALGLAIGHIVLAVACWHYAVILFRSGPEIHGV